MTDSTIGEALPFGETVRSQGRTISEGEFAMLTDLTWTTRERHANQEFMAKSQSKDRELAGPVVLSLVASLAALSPLNRRLHEEFGISTLGALQHEADYGNPVHPGDTLWAETELMDARDSSSTPGQGVLRIRDRGVNQRGETVIEITRTLLISRAEDGRQDRT